MALFQWRQRDASETSSEFRAKTCLLSSHCLLKYSPIWSIHTYVNTCTTIYACQHSQIPQMLKKCWDFHEVVSVILIVCHCWRFPSVCKSLLSSRRLMLLKKNFCGSFMYTLFLFQPVYTLAKSRKSLAIFTISFWRHFDVALILTSL